MSNFKTLVKTTLTPVALCLALAVTGPAIAKKGQHQKHDGMRQILSELSLTDTQKQDIKQILQQTRQDRELFSGDAKTFKTELRSLVQSTEWDQTAIQNAIGQHQTLRQEKALQRATNKNQVWNLLTETQQAEFVAQIAARKAERQDTNGENNKKGKRKGKNLKRLELSEEQASAVEVIKTSAKANGAETKAKLKTYREAERALIQSTEFNTEAWQTLNSEYQVDFLTIAVLKAKTRHDIWNLLTSEQKVKAQKINVKKSKSNKKMKRNKQQDA